MQSVAYVWAKIIHELEEKLSSITVSSLFDDTELIELNDTNLIIYTPSDFRREVILRSCKLHIEEILQTQFGQKIQLLVFDDAELGTLQQGKNPENIWQINPHFRFDTFVAGSQNDVPLKVAMHIAEHVGDSVYNPLYYYGPPGVGKTHLLYSIANRISQISPKAKIVYVKGDQFTNELIQAIQHGSTITFKKKYREADILLVDDIQFIAGKDSTQEEFFHTFNNLYEMHKQIVLASDRSPNDMPLLQDRLKGRFGEGVMLKIEPPDLNTRKQIIRNKAIELHLKFHDEVIDYLSEHLCENVRQIEGGLRKIKAFKDLSNMQLNLTSIAKTIADLHQPHDITTITPDTVVRYVCRYYGVDEAQLKSASREKSVTEPRQIAAYLICELTSCTLGDVGKYFNRDRSTINHAIKKIQSQLACKDNNMTHILRDIRMSIEANT